MRCIFTAMCERPLIKCNHFVSHFVCAATVYDAAMCEQGVSHT